MMPSRLLPCCGGLLALLVSSCTGLKYATEEKPLFSAYEVRWDVAPLEEEQEVTRELEKLIQPAPNNSIFGLRPTVALHNMTKEPKKPKGLRRLLKYKIGSAPVYMDQVPVADINAAMVNRLHNRGYFAATSGFAVERDGKTARAIFQLSAGIPHRVRTIAHGDGTDSLNVRIARTARSSLVEPGDLYDLERLKEERVRVVSILRNRGYYRLKEDDLVFIADTTVGERQCDLVLRVKAETLEEALRSYALGEVRVHGDYDGLLPANDTLVVDSVRYVNYLNNYRPSVITRGAFLRPGDPYSARAEENTQRYLSSYGVFRSVDVRYVEDSLRPGILKTDVFVVPQKRWTLFTELNAISKSNNFAGPGVKGGFKDRNLFRGAELFTADVNGRYETQIAGAQRGTNAYELGLKLALRIPRIVPFQFLRSARYAVPTTTIELGYGIFRRIDLYGVESFNSALGYAWRANRRVWHDLRPLEVSYNKLYFSSAAFDAFLDQNTAVRRSFEQQFIIGAGYTYTLNTQRRGGRGWLLLSLGIDEGGNLTSVLSRAGGQRPEDGYTVFSERYAQFVRFRPEIRYYKPLDGRGGLLATRMLVNVGLPYGNSDVLPYVKRFFSGGPNSLRAFRARGVGPGSYVPAEGGALQVDQVGDIQFEVNAEYRFTIAGYFKGALFADAGNIWLVKDDPQRPGALFKWSDAVDQLALGTGFGLRFDPEVIVVRLDLATPLRLPSLPQGDRWVFDDLRPRIFDNIVFNIAIGYPF